MTQKMLLVMYEYSHSLISQGIEGIGHEASLIKTPGSDNPANWILGHIITSRSNVLAMLNADPPWDYQRCLPYLPRSQPLAPGAEAEDFPGMVSTLDQSQAALLALLNHISEKDLDKASGESTLGEELAGYAIHEAFHAGELAIINSLLRR